jgi:putative salt-induced outer membrane protein YdiY
MLSHYLRCRVLFVLLCSILPLAAHADTPKTDVIVLKNGDAVTGEIKGLEFGALTYSTDSMGTVSIDWEDITRVTSKQSLQVEVVDGTRYFGSIPKSDDEHKVTIKTDGDTYVFPAEEVVRITPIETDESFFQRLDGNFSLGLQTQKSSEVTTSNTAGDINYRTRKYMVTFNFNSSVTDQPGQPTSARQATGFNYQRFRPARWFTDWFTTWEKNDELGINGRVSLGGGIGRYVLQTNKNQLSWGLGLQGSRTSYIGEDASDTDAEGRIQLRYQRRGLTPDTSILLTATVYPLLEDLTQFRAESDITLMREIINDLYLNLGVGYSYTSYPPTGAANSDYVFTTSIGYSF